MKYVAEFFLRQLEFISKSYLFKYFQTVITYKMFSFNNVIH